MFEPLASWFAARYGEPNAVQRAAWRHTFAGENTLLIAPTGSGKTLAAFVSVLSDLGERAAARGLGNVCRAVYLSPLRALGRDIFRNLEEPLAAINESLPPARRIRIEMRTGDTAAKDRARMARRRPHILLTTPESLTSLLSQQSWREGLDAATVIADEIHALAESKRGTLLAVALERLEARAQQPPQRIGLSATAEPATEVARLLCGARPCRIVSVGVRRQHILDIELPAHLPAAGYDPGRIAHAAAAAIGGARTALVFTSTRSAAERLGMALGVLQPEWEERIGVHHSSIERGVREQTEARLAAGEMKAVVCSTSLELGVDYDAVDLVTLAGTPRGVSRALQRLGRSGHSRQGPARGRIVPLSLPDLVEAVAMRRAVAGGAIEALRIPRVPLDLLAQALLGMAVERPHSIAEAVALLRRTGPYLDAPDTDFRQALEYLAGGGRVLARYGKIVVEDGVFRVASKKIAREYFQAIGAISEDYRVSVHAKNGRRLGDVEENFLAGLRPGEAFVMGGKAVEVESRHGARVTVKPSASERVQTPRWMGGKMPLSARMAAEELALRRALRSAFESGGPRAVERMLRRDYDCAAPCARALAAFTERQYKAAPIPIDAPVQVERIVRGRTQLVLIHCLAGRAVNQALSWVAAHRLAAGQSAVSNSDDHGHLLVLPAKLELDPARLRNAYAPARFLDDLECVLRGIETLGRKFRAVAETGQLMPKRSVGRAINRRFAQWNASLLYETLLRYEPDHLLLRETVREVMDDVLDSDRGAAEARRLFESEWEWFEQPRPSPFALPLYMAFNRDVLLAQDPHGAFAEFAETLYEEWAG